MKHLKWVVGGATWLFVAVLVWFKFGLQWWAAAVIGLLLALPSVGALHVVSTGEFRASRNTRIVILTVNFLALGAVASYLAWRGKSFIAAAGAVGTLSYLMLAIRALREKGCG